MSSLKEKIVGVISKHLGLDDTYTYELTRDKSGFTVGTVDIDDFEEWSEENIDDLADSIVESLQPQLNENQKDLVIWMQENECSTDDPLESISDLFLEGTPSEYFPDAPLSCVEAAYQSLNKKQKLELVQEYVKKALEQEEGK